MGEGGGEMRHNSIHTDFDARNQRSIPGIAFKSWAQGSREKPVSLDPGPPAGHRSGDGNGESARKTPGGRAGPGGGEL